MFEYLLPSWWHCMSVFRKCSLAKGRMSLRVGLEVSESDTIPYLLSLFVVEDVRSQLLLYLAITFML